MLKTPIVMLGLFTLGCEGGVELDYKATNSRVATPAEEVPSAIPPEEAEEPAADPSAPTAISLSPAARTYFQTRSAATFRLQNVFLSVDDEIRLEIEGEERPLAEVVVDPTMAQSSEDLAYFDIEFGYGYDNWSLLPYGVSLLSYSLLTKSGRLTEAKEVTLRDFTVFGQPGTTFVRSPQIKAGFQGWHGTLISPIVIDQESKTKIVTGMYNQIND